MSLLLSQITDIIVRAPFVVPNPPVVGIWTYRPPFNYALANPPVAAAVLPFRNVKPPGLYEAPAWQFVPPFNYALTNTPAVAASPFFNQHPIGPIGIYEPSIWQYRAPTNLILQVSTAKPPQPRAWNYGGGDTPNWQFLQPDNLALLSSLSPPGQAPFKPPAWRFDPFETPPQNPKYFVAPFPPGPDTLPPGPHPWRFDVYDAPAWQFVPRINIPLRDTTAVQAAPFSPQRPRFDVSDQPGWQRPPSANVALLAAQTRPSETVVWAYGADSSGVWQYRPQINIVLLGTAQPPPKPFVPPYWNFNYNDAAFWQHLAPNVSYALVTPGAPVPLPEPPPPPDESGLRWNLEWVYGRKKRKKTARERLDEILADVIAEIEGSKSKAAVRKASRVAAVRIKRAGLLEELEAAAELEIAVQLELSAAYERGHTNVIAAIAERRAAQMDDDEAALLLLLANL